MKRQFVVLDRDGTVITERHYLSDPRQIELLPGSVRGLRRMLEMGLGLVMITNQSAVGRRFFNEDRLELIHGRLRELLRAEEIQLAGIYYCPHTPEHDCLCRKPRTGLIERAASQLDFDLAASFVVGDKATDIEMGRQVRATTFLVRTGYGAEVAADPGIRPDYIVDDLWGVAQTIQGLVGGPESRLDR